MHLFLGLRLQMGIHWCGDWQGVNYLCLNGGQVDGWIYTQGNPFFTQKSHLACPGTTFASVPEGLTSSWRDDRSLRWKESQELIRGLAWQTQCQNMWDKGTRLGTGKAPLFLTPSGSLWDTLTAHSMFPVPRTTQVACANTTQVTTFTHVAHVLH